ncbi:MAG: putative membrane protein [Acidimicrobiales bacterium]|jgi:uncharacterized membrane protein
MTDPSAIYRIILLLHIVAAVVGFGGVIAHGAYNAKAFRSAAGEAAVLFRTTKAVTNLAHYAIYALFVLGIILVSLSDGQISFGDPWISASFIIWIALVGVAHGLVRPAVQALLERSEALSESTSLTTDSDATAAAKKLALGEGLTQLLLTVALVMMVWQFGG